MSGLAPSKIDLCTVDELADWSNTPTAKTKSDVADILQELITGWSRHVLWTTGRRDTYFTGDEGEYTTYKEVRDGNGSSSMGVLNGPIETVLLVQVNGVEYGESVTWNQGGWFVETGACFIGLRVGAMSIPGGFPFSGSSFSYTPGKGNVLLSYTGGYNAVPEDLYLATLKTCTVYLAKRLREDEGSRSIPSSGSVSGYRSWAYPPEVARMLNNYRRTIMAGS